MHAGDRLRSLMSEVAPLTLTAARNAFIAGVRVFSEHFCWRRSIKKCPSTNIGGPKTRLRKFDKDRFPSLGKGNLPKSTLSRLAAFR